MKFEKIPTILQGIENCYKENSKDTLVSVKVGDLVMLREYVMTLQKINITLTNDVEISNARRRLMSDAYEEQRKSSVKELDTYF